MLIKIETWVVLDVKDKDEAEEACMKLDAGLDSALRDFPVGEMVATDVDHYEEVDDEEAEEQGWVE